MELHTHDGPPLPLDSSAKVYKSEMISSVISASSSLTSPVDSGVQLLDSENDLLSVMTNSGLGSDLDNLDSESTGQFTSSVADKEEKSAEGFDNTECEKLNEMFKDLITSAHEALHSGEESVRVSSRNSDGPAGKIESQVIDELREQILHPKLEPPREKCVMTKSDIANQNHVTHPEILPQFSTSAPNCDFFPLVQTAAHSLFNHTDLLTRSTKPEDIMNVSLNSYELLDYTVQNKNLKDEDQMHVSMSEEVNELQTLISKQEAAVAAEIQMEPITEVHPEVVPDEQIVFRRQRKKKSKSDTPKKRVSFHEDILNSTKIDDIHINHGFITMEPDVSTSFFQRGFIRKPGVVEGRYSWAAEGDAPFYPARTAGTRDIKSDIYIQQHSSLSSNSTTTSSSSATSSIDEEEDDDDNEDSGSSGGDSSGQSDPAANVHKQPKSSCLKKGMGGAGKGYIGTEIVVEEGGKNGGGSRRRKRSESLLDGNLFGSLKSMFGSVTPLMAERGVPEGQEDVTGMLATSEDSCIKPRSRPTSQHLHLHEPADCDIPHSPILIAPKKTVGKLNLELIKNNLRLTTGEGFHPHYPPSNLPANVMLCDSNVYEHTGISYSYEYDNFQRTFETEPPPPKSSTVYQKILKEFNVFRRRAIGKAKENEKPEINAMPPPPEQQVNGEDEFEFINAVTPTNDDTHAAIVDAELELDPDDDESIANSSLMSKSINQFATASKMDWSDANDTSTPDSSNNPRHLNSPKHKINRTNHYALQNYKFEYSEPTRSEFEGHSSKSLPNLRSKTSLINRFLRNVTVKKMLDLKLQQTSLNRTRKYLNLYIKDVNAPVDCNKQIDHELESEILANHRDNPQLEVKLDKATLTNLKALLRDKNETLLHTFCVYSAYTTTGCNKPLVLILTTATLYVADYKPDNTVFSNHFVLPYVELNTVLIGPNAQTIHMANYDGDMQCIVVTGCGQVTGTVMARLEMAMRRDKAKPALPAVKQLTMRDMATLRRSVCRQTAVHKHEEYFYYSIVNLQEYNTEGGETVMGPNKEGPLMFKISEIESRWETAYFILKAGVLYMLSAPSNRVPMRVMPLVDGACQGARRVFSARPHTFQLIVNGVVLHLAAPDEYVASDWLQALVHAASTGNINTKEKNLSASCSLLMTSDHILTVREAFPCNILSSSFPKTEHTPIKGATTLSCAAISDITAFRLPSAEHSWCVLEFACREVHESSGDWILYFSSNVELENFISTLEMLWDYHNQDGECFPLSTIPETDSLNKRSFDIYKQLQNAWPSPLLSI